MLEGLINRLVVHIQAEVENVRRLIGGVLNLHELNPIYHLIRMDGSFTSTLLSWTLLRNLKI